jgi:putative endonuclease
MDRSLRQQAAYAKGTHAEMLAMQHLHAQGFTLIAQRYKSAAGEIDIIVAKDRVLVCVEVKARTTSEDGLLSITPRQMKRIMNAAEIFLSEHDHFTGYDIRFDVITIADDGTLTHLPHAFDGDY